MALTYSIRLSLHATRSTRSTTCVQFVVCPVGGFEPVLKPWLLRTCGRVRGHESALDRAVARSAAPHWQDTA